MKFSYNWLKELAGFKESPRHLAEFLTLRAFEVESVAKKGKDWVLDVKLFPNRVADASGHAGMAREIATLKKPETRDPKPETNPKPKIQNPKLTETNRRASDLLKIKVENPYDCPRYTVRVMTGVKVGPSPKWMRERLETCGLQSINNIVDAANYMMLELGQPLHVFDYDELKNTKLKAQSPNKAQSPKPKTIIVRRSRKGERLLALDDKIYTLSPEVLVIADEVAPIAIAGIKGGGESGVAPKTKTIVLESANFDPVRTRIATKLLNLKTDASWRFERGMDPNQTVAAVDRLAALVQRVAGGEILAGRVDAYPKPLKPLKILLRLDYTSRLIGKAIPPAFIESGFKRLGWDFKKRGRDYLIKPPTVRRDIRIEEDIIEEIACLWGYEKIQARAPAIAIAAKAPPEELQWENKIKDILMAAGFSEVLTYVFAGKKLLEVFGDSPQGLLELENPTSPETQYLSSHPAQQYLKIAADNLRHREAVGIFGIAKGFKPAAKPSAKMPAEERKHLVVVKAAKEASRNSSKNTAEAEAFYAVKGTLDHLFEALGIAEHWYDDALTPAERKKTAALHPYRTAKVMVGDEFLGVVAELHPAVQQRLKSKARLVFAQIDFDKLWRHARAEAEFKPIGKYPAVIRDIAVVVPENTKADDVEGVIQNAGGKLLADSDLFDYFQDEAMAERGEKSLAFHLIFQSPARTLTDEEVNRLYRNITKALKEREWEVRE